DFGGAHDRPPRPKMATNGVTCCEERRGPCARRRYGRWRRRNGCARWGFFGIEASSDSAATRKSSRPGRLAPPELSGRAVLLGIRHEAAASSSAVEWTSLVIRLSAHPMQSPHRYNGYFPNFWKGGPPLPL